MKAKTIAILPIVGLFFNLSASALDEWKDNGVHTKIPENESSIGKNAKMPTIDLEKLKSSFNAMAGQVRIVSILSPTCSACQEGHGAVRKVFAQIKSDHLKGLLVWLPMKVKDSAHMALAQSSSLKDSRIAIEGWDAGKGIAKLFSKTLDLKVAAWDVYLVYASGVKWTSEAPPKPTYWMHQLDSSEGANPKQCLNVTKLKEEIRKLL